MNIIGNILWFVLGGFILALLWFLAGLLCCITIIGIPIGIQCFKIGELTAFPFGKDISYHRAGFASFLGNLIWILLFGWELSLICLALGLLFCTTIIGIPFGLQYFKFAQLSFMPFGADIR